MPLIMLYVVYLFVISCYKSFPPSTITLKENPEQNVLLYDEYTTIITNDVYETITNTETVIVTSDIIQYLTSTEIIFSTFQHNNTDYSTYTMVQLDTTCVTATIEHFTCETIKTTVSHFNTICMFETNTSLNTVFSTPYITICHEINVTSNIPVQVTHTKSLTKIDVVYMTVSTCYPTRVLKNLDELTNTVITFQADQRCDFNEFLGEKCCKKNACETILTCSENELTANVFNWELLYQINCKIGKADVALFRNMNQATLLNYQKLQLQLLKQGGTLEAQNSLFYTFIEEISASWYMFLGRYDSIESECISTYAQLPDLNALHEQFLAFGAEQYQKYTGFAGKLDFVYE